MYFIHISAKIQLKNLNLCSWQRRETTFRLGSGKFVLEFNPFTWERRIQIIWVYITSDIN